MASLCFQAAALSSLSSPRMMILNASSGRGRCSAFASRNISFTPVIRSFVPRGTCRFGSQACLAAISSPASS
jgi:hypothetical protein